MNTAHTNQKHFDEVADHWEDDPKHVELGQTVAYAICDALALRGTERALEFGAGTGLLSTIIAPKVASPTATDVSSGMRSVLRGKRDAQSLANLAVRVGTVLADLPDEMFDVIYSSMTLHHIDRVPELFQRLAAHLRSGGRVAFADIARGDGSFSNAAVGVVHHGFGRQEFGHWLEAAGFPDVQFRDLTTVEHTDDQGATHSHTVFLCIARWAPQAGPVPAHHGCISTATAPTGRAGGCNRTSKPHSRTPSTGRRRRTWARF